MSDLGRCGHCGRVLFDDDCPCGQTTSGDPCSRHEIEGCGCDVCRRRLRLSVDPLRLDLDRSVGLVAGIELTRPEKDALADALWEAPVEDFPAWLESARSRPVP